MFFRLSKDYMRYRGEKVLKSRRYFFKWKGLLLVKCIIDLVILVRFNFR